MPIEGGALIRRTGPPLGHGPNEPQDVDVVVGVVRGPSRHVTDRSRPAELPGSSGATVSEKHRGPGRRGRRIRGAPGDYDGLVAPQSTATDRATHNALMVAG